MPALPANSSFARASRHFTVTNIVSKNNTVIQNNVQPSLCQCVGSGIFSTITRPNPEHLPQNGSWPPQEHRSVVKPGFMGDFAKSVQTCQCRQFQAAQERFPQAKTDSW